MRLLKNTLILGILIVTMLSVSASSVTDIISEGATKTYSLDGTNYVVTASYVGATNALFTVNSQVTDKLANNGEFTLSDGRRIYVINILAQNVGGEVQGDQIEFGLYNPCGDGSCDEGETCAADNCCDGDEVDFSDVNNCGRCGNVCDDYEICQGGKCVGYCGNNICERAETCDQDNCCEGQNTNFELDIENCGSCANKCDFEQKCENGECVDVYYCGDRVCRGEENCANCVEDCGCRNDYKCVNNVCKIPDECVLNYDCDDGDECTRDFCSGRPRKCIYTDVEGCGVELIEETEPEKTEPKAETPEEQVIEITGDVTLEEKEEIAKTAVIKKKEPSELFVKIVRWFRSLFG